MKTIIYWFSGTGNSLAAARMIAARLDGDVELAPVATAMKRDYPTAQRVGIVFPVYAFGPPVIVMDFLQRLPAAADSYIFAVATCGGMTGRTFGLMRRALAGRGLKLAAGWALKNPGNCISLYSSPAPPRQQKLFLAATSKIERIAQGVISGRQGPVEDSVPPISWLGGLMWRAGTSHFAAADRKFYATDACIHCGLCERICPVENIRLIDGRPQWLHHCQQCMACIQWCPVQAIQYGKHTAGRARYHHPEVTAADLCLRDNPAGQPPAAQAK